jgi:hypothetical protein
MKDYILRAQKNYIDRKRKNGWCTFSTFVPIEIKNKLLEIKHQMMKEYYAKKSDNE